MTLFLNHLVNGNFISQFRYPLRTVIKRDFRLIQKQRVLFKGLLDITPNSNWNEEIMSKQEWVQVGKIKDAFHLKGEVFALVFSGEWEWLKDLEICLIGDKTFKVNKAREHKNGLVLALDGVKDRTQAEKLIGLMFSIPEEMLISEEGESIYLSEILNFKVTDSNSSYTGIIEAFSSNGFQDLLVVQINTENRKVEIPFVDDFIVEIDFDSQVVEMDLPEGIWDIQ